MPTVTLYCRTCKQRFRLTRYEPLLTLRTPNYCPLCGASSVGTYQDTDQDIWEVYSLHYNLKIKTLKLLYEVFCQSNDTHFDKFIERVKDAQSNR